MASASHCVHFSTCWLYSICCCVFYAFATSYLFDLFLKSMRLHLCLSPYTYIFFIGVEGSMKQSSDFHPCIVFLQGLRRKKMDHLFCSLATLMSNLQRRIVETSLTDLVEMIETYCEGNHHDGNYPPDSQWYQVKPHLIFIFMVCLISISFHINLSEAAKILHYIPFKATVKSKSQK